MLFKHAAVLNDLFPQNWSVNPLLLIDQIGNRKKQTYVNIYMLGNA